MIRNLTFNLLLQWKHMDRDTWKSKDELKEMVLYRWTKSIPQKVLFYKEIHLKIQGIIFRSKWSSVSGEIRVFENNTGSPKEERERESSPSRSCASSLGRPECDDKKASRNMLLASKLFSRFMGCVYRRGIGLDLLTNYTHHSELHVITAPPLITFYSLPQHPLSLFQPAMS
jgi:hypothetical protein